MKNNDLTYSISNWTQATKCLSNNSKHLKICVSNIQYSSKLNGTLLSVVHDSMGALFATLIGGYGSMLTEDSCNNYHEMNVEDILAELKKFGFNIVFNPHQHLSGDQLSYLMNLRELGFDKIRTLNVKVKDTSGTPVTQSVIVVFKVCGSVANWLNNTHTCSEAEFNAAMLTGVALNISGISMSRQFDWSWLTFVADIDDVLKDNMEVQSNVD